MKKLLISIGLITATSSAFAQDLHFSQILQSPNLLNPGAVGVYDGWERVALHHRNQWLGGSTSFMSSGLNVDACLFKDVIASTTTLGHWTAVLQRYRRTFQIWNSECSTNN